MWSGDQTPLGPLFWPSLLLVLNFINWFSPGNTNRINSWLCGVGSVGLAIVLSLAIRETHDGIGISVVLIAIRSLFIFLGVLGLMSTILAIIHPEDFEGRFALRFLTIVWGLASACTVFLVLWWGAERDLVV